MTIDRISQRRSLWLFFCFTCIASTFSCVYEVSTVTYPLDLKNQESSKRVGGVNRIGLSTEICFVDLEPYPCRQLDLAIGYLPWGDHTHPCIEQHSTHRNLHKNKPKSIAEDRSGERQAESEGRGSLRRKNTEDLDYTQQQNSTIPALTVQPEARNRAGHGHGRIHRTETSTVEAKNEANNINIKSSGDREDYITRASLHQRSSNITSDNNDLLRTHNPHRRSRDLHPSEGRTFTTQKNPVCCKATNIDEIYKRDKGSEGI